MDNILNLIRKYKNGESNYLLPLIDMFDPIFASYEKKSTNLFDGDDMRNILIIKFIEVIKCMPHLENDGQLVCYINKAIKNYYINIVSKKVIQTPLLDYNSYNISTNDTYSNVFFEDIIKKLDEKDKILLRLKFYYSYSDLEIAKKYNISRQAINKKLRNIYKKLNNGDLQNGI